MLYPDIDKFRELSEKGNLIPVYREILADLDTPVSAYMKLMEKPAFLLESVEGGEKWARYSFVGIKPQKVIRGKGRNITITDEGKTESIDVENPIHLLRKIMSAYSPVELEGLPRFFGGLVGYLGYDMVRFMEELPQDNTEGMDMPDMFLMLTDTMLIFDNLRQTIKVVYNVHLNGQTVPQGYDDAVKRIDDVIEMLNRPLPGRGGKSTPITNDTGASEGFTSSFSDRSDFETAVRRAQEYIEAGDIFQVVLSQRFERPYLADDPFDIYRSLRVINPSPYMYYIDTGDACIIGSSPEILVRLEDEQVTLRPIAGTRPRGKDEAEDKEFEEDLRNDPKEVAEHIMLVDLGRNDVGRVSKIGSVKVTDLMSADRYSHVMHLVSNVEGDLEDGLDSFDVLNACFPAGTVTGAPKIRAMEIIEELEPLRRGPYAGSIGYFGYSGNMDTCITIRTIFIKDKTVFLQAGAGIVANSVPANEYMETVNKAMGMMKAVDMAERGLR